MMQVVFPTYDELPSGGVLSKPNATSRILSKPNATSRILSKPNATSFLYRVPPKSDTGIAGADLDSISLVLKRMRDCQKPPAIHSADNGYRRISGYDQDWASRPLLGHLSHSLDNTQARTVTDIDFIRFSSDNSRWRRLGSFTDLHVKKSPKDPVIVNMSYKRFSNPDEECDVTANTNLLPLYSKHPKDLTCHTAPPHKPLHAPKDSCVHATITTTTTTTTTTDALPWSDWVQSHKVTASAQMAPNHHPHPHPHPHPSQPMDKDISTSSQRSPISLKSDGVVSFDASTTTPVKGILKSCRASSRSPSLEDGEHNGSTNTSKSFCSQGCKKRVKFLERDTVSTIPNDDGSSLNLEAIERTAVDRDIIDGFDVSNQPIFAQKRDVTEKCHAEKSNAFHGKVTTTQNTGKPTALSRDPVNPKSSRNKNNAILVPNGCYSTNDRVVWTSVPLIDSGRSLRGLDDLRSMTSIPARLCGRPGDNNSDSDTRKTIIHKFASLPRRSKSRHSLNSAQFFATNSTNQVSAKGNLPPNVEGSKKAFRKDFAPTSVSEKENHSNQVESHAWSSSKGSKVKGKGSTRSKNGKQGRNFCSDEKTLLIMEWLDAVHSHEPHKVVPTAKVIAAK